MKMSPKHGWLVAPEHTWVLAGEPADPILVYSLSGNGINSLPAKAYRAMWFDPHIGSMQDAKTVAGAAQTMLTKPDARNGCSFFDRTMNKPVRSH
jgi:hypothetical protein